MANKITRTITTAYNYNAFLTEGDTMKKIGSVSVAEQIRSSKLEKAILLENKLDEKAVLILAGTNEKKYEISEEDFIAHATEVVETPTAPAK